MNSDFIPQHLEDQMQLLAEMIENSAEAIIARGSDGKFICWNSGAEKLFGFSKQEALGKTAADIKFILLSPSEISNIENKIQEFGSWKSERTFFNKNGNKFLGAATGNKVSSKNGGEDYFYFIIKDISNHIKLEANLQRNNEELELLLKFRTEELRKAEEYYHSLFENNPMPMWVIDAETFKFLDVNQCAIQQYGYSREEFLSMTALDIREEADKPSFINLYRGLDTGSKIINRGVWKHKIKDGSIIYVEITAQNLNYHGVSARLILANNITEKYIAEEKLIANEKRFKSLIENSYDGFSMVDEKHNIIYRSPSAARIIGWSDEEIIQSESISFIHPDDKNHLHNINNELVKNPGKTYHIEYRMLHKDGHYIDVEGTVTNFLNDKNINAIVINFHDVTERKLKEAQIQASEIRFRSLIENSSDAFTMFDESLNIIFRSQSSERITGWRNDEVSQLNILQGIHPDDFKNIYRTILDIKRGKFKSCNVEFRLKHKNGNFIYINGYISNLLKDENVKAIIFNFQDVTDRKIIETKIQTSEVRFRSLIENSYDAFTMFDGSLNILYRSQSAERITGFSNEEMQNINIIDNIFPDDLNYAKHLINDVILNDGKSSKIEFRIKHKNGHFIYVEGFITNLLKKENVNAIVFNFQDVTDRKTIEAKIQASEIRFRSLIENSKDVFVMFDKSFNIIYRSPSAYRVTGFTDNDLLGKNGIVNVHPDDVAEIKLVIDDLLNCPGKMVKVLFRNKHKDANYINIEGVITNLLNDDNVNAIVFSFQDVTEVIKAEQERNKMNDEIIKRSKRLEQFAYIISHNLRLPVANILGIADYLKGNIVEEDRANMVDFLSSATVQLDEVIKDLNNILQIQSQIAEYKEVVSMSKLVADIKSSIKMLLHNYHVTIDLDFTAKDDITTIKSYLYSIFYNLISNSVKYRKLDVPLVISLRSKVVQDKLIITVKDNGLGFNYKQNAEKIFGLYKRFHPEIEGKGIGLFLVKTQVETLDGTISVSSELGQGTEFTIEFPLIN